jgi:hypothetical protein
MAFNQKRKGNQPMIAKNSFKWLSALFVSLLFSTSTLVQADILDNWHWRNPSPFPDTMHSVTFGAGEFVAVGDGGVVHASSDGTNWDAGRRPVLFTLNKVIYANGEFIAVGNSGSIIISTNGVDWTVQNSGVANDLYAVAYGNGRFVVCGLNGQLVISTNGTDWTSEINSSVGASWITFGNGVFVAHGPGTSVEVSADGQSWASFGLPFLGYSWPHTLYQAEYGNGMFVAVASGDSSSDPEYSGLGAFFYASVDGTNWVQKTYFNFGPLNSSVQQFLVFLNGAFHEVNGGSGYSFVPISITTDGTSYTTKFAPTNAPNAQSMTYGNGKYLLIEQSGKSWVSTDETNWTATYSGLRDSLRGPVQGVNSNLLAVGPMLVSTDGVNFNGPYNPSDSLDPLYAAAFDGTNYVAVGGFGSEHDIGNGVVYTSTNGMDWVQRTSNADSGLLAICQGPSRWVAVGMNGTVISSANTLAWTLRSSGTANDLNAVSYGNGLYVAVGSGGTVITSSDGSAWDVQFSGTVNNLNGIVFQNGQFTAVGGSGTILTSPDGANWTGQTSGATAATLHTVAYGNGIYLASGFQDSVLPLTGDVFLTSTNGTNWQNISTKIPTAVIVHSTAYVNQSFWIVGDNGMLLQSDVADGIPHFAGAMMPGNGGLKLKVTLNPPVSYRVQFRTNMTDGWHDVYTNSTPTGSDIWTDTNAAQRPSGFYRIVSP